MISHFFYKRGYHIYKLYPKPFVKCLKEKYNNKELVGCEIGVYDGINAKSILDNLHIKTLYLIDPYINYPEYNDSFALTKGRNLENAEKECRKRLRKYNNVVFIKKMSFEGLKDIKERLDFIYIDGNPNYIKKELDLAYDKLNTGGLIIANSSVNLDIKYNFSKKKGCKSYLNNMDWWIVKLKEDD